MHGAEHVKTVELLNKLALVLRDQGKLDEAEEVFYRVLAIDQKTSKTEEEGGRGTQGERLRDFFHPPSRGMDGF